MKAIEAQDFLLQEGLALYRSLLFATAGFAAVVRQEPTLSSLQVPDIQPRAVAATNAPSGL